MRGSIGDVPVGVILRLAALAGMAVSVPAMAKTKAAKSSDGGYRLDCKNPQAQIEMTACARLDYENADAELKRLWPKAVAAARTEDADKFTARQMRERDAPTTFEALRAAERAWIAYRDAECTYESYQAFGGTMQPMLALECRTRLTRSHIDELKKTLVGLGR